MGTPMLYSVEGNAQKLDGGAMFGNCPKPLWERWAAPDERNRIRLACRCLLVREPSGRHVLLETGIGMFFEPKLRERFGVEGSEHVLLASLRARGVAPEDIDVVVLSHLHFDHAGGLLTPFTPGVPPSLVFPRARYVVGREAWTRALRPHARDKASFIEALPGLLKATGRLELVDRTDGSQSVTRSRSETLGADYSFYFSDGHTPGLMLTRFEGHAEGPMTFMGDLIPGAAWTHLPITMGYDRFPERLIEEKQHVLDAVIAESGWAFFTHDPDVACAKVVCDAHGKYGTATPRRSLDG
jgi:glyoxylase-like metal-dependent hydrolase (beta-lactamase superfamily II)